MDETGQWPTSSFEVSLATQLPVSKLNCLRFEAKEHFSNLALSVLGLSMIQTGQTPGRRQWCELPNSVAQG